MTADFKMIGAPKDSEHIVSYDLLFHSHLKWGFNETDPYIQRAILQKLSLHDGRKESNLTLILAGKNQ